MPGRDVSIPVAVASKSGRTKYVLVAAAAAAVFALGIAIGSRIAAPSTTSAPLLPAKTAGSGAASPPQRPKTAPTPAGAVAAAARSITAFDGDVLLSPERLRALVGRIASNESRLELVAAFSEASEQTRAKLGAATVPRPVIVLRSVPIGYRIDRFSKTEATVAVWYVGIVGSGASVQPQQSWRTQIVNLVWEHRAWKVRSFASSPGPTPPLPPPDTTAPAGDLFTSIPRFEEFRHAEP